MTMGVTYHSAFREQQHGDPQDKCILENKGFLSFTIFFH